jgi:uncharacterized Fe-S cluster protein YjdI
MLKKEYSNDKITVVWKPDICIHSEKCFHGLGKVFNPNQRPWIDLSQASDDEIIKQVNNCPSGALTMKESNDSNSNETTKIQLFPGGPAVLKGACEVVNEDGQVETRKNVALCRCTKSANFPYCDGSHSRQ